MAILISARRKAEMTKSSSEPFWICISSGHLQTGNGEMFRENNVRASILNNLTNIKRRDTKEKRYFLIRNKFGYHIHNYIWCLFLFNIFRKNRPILPVFPAMFSLVLFYCCYNNILHHSFMVFSFLKDVCILARICQLNLWSV